MRFPQFQPLCTAPLRGFSLRRHSGMRNGSPWLRNNTRMSSNSQTQILLSAHFSVRYSGKPPVLRGVELEIQRGEGLGLVGQSGSGKSTLAFGILGLLEQKRSPAE